MEILLLLAIVAASLPLALYARASRSRREHALFERVAAKYPEARVESGGLWGRNELHVRFGDHDITVWMWTTKNSRGTIWETTSLLPSFRIYREGLASTFAKSMLGSQDIELGLHPTFDAHFMVKGDDPPLLRHLWTRQLCDKMLTAFTDGIVESQPGRLALTHHEMTDDASLLMAGIDLLSALLGRDLYGAEALRAVDESTFHTSTPPYIVVRGPVNIQIGAVATAAGTVTRATCPAGHGEPDPDLLAATGGVFSYTDKQFHITWPGIETVPERLAAAVRLLRELHSGPSLGAFR